MAERSITHTALSGFRYAREKPGVVALWIALTLAFSFAVAALQVTMVGGVLAQMRALQAHPDPSNPLAAVSLLGQLMPFYGLLLVVSVVFGAVTTGAASRSVLRPAEQGLGYLRFGADEVRLIVVSVVIGLILGVVYIVGAVIGGIVGGIIAFATGNAPTPGATQIPAGYLAILGACLLPVLGVLVFLWTKFSLAFAQTVDERAIRIFGSWALTERRFWRVFGTYLLSVLFFLPVGLVAGAVIVGAATILGGGLGAVTALFQPDTSSLASFFRPVTIIYMGVVGILNGLGLAVFVRTPAVIYAELADRMPEDVF